MLILPQPSSFKCPLLIDLIFSPDDFINGRNQNADCHSDRLACSDAPTLRGFIKLDSTAPGRSEAEIGFSQASQIQLKANSLGSLLQHPVSWVLRGPSCSRWQLPTSWCWCLLTRRSGTRRGVTTPSTHLSRNKSIHVCIASPVCTARQLR